MREVKLTIDGKEVPLTEEHVKLLGIEIEEKRKNPFDRVADGDPYYYIAADCYVYSVHENYNQCDYDAYYNVKYFNDKNFAYQITLHQSLYRKLLKFAYDNECEDNQEWDCNNRHWCIRYDHCDKVFSVTWYDTFQSSGVYFSTMESAERAIKEVVEPFMKENPDFVW